MAEICCGDNALRLEVIDVLEHAQSSAARNAHAKGDLKKERHFISVSVNRDLFEPF